MASFIGIASVAAVVVVRRSGSRFEIEGATYRRCSTLFEDGLAASARETFEVCVHTQSCTDYGRTRGR